MLRLLVENIPPACDEASLNVWFGQRGYVVSFARIVRDQTTDGPKCFAFVELKTTSDMKEAVRLLHGQSMSGRMLAINVSTPSLNNDGRRAA